MDQEVSVEVRQRPGNLVTGGSRGLGRSMAEHLAHRGVDVVLTYHRNEMAAAEVAAAVEAAGARALALQLDVADAGTFPAFAEELRARLEPTFGRSTIDHLVNNAGVGVHAPVLQLTEDQFDTLVNVHLRGPLSLTQAVAPLLRDGGSIPNVSSDLTGSSCPASAPTAR